MFRFICLTLLVGSVVAFNACKKRNGPQQKPELPVVGDFIRTIGNVQQGGRVEVAFYYDVDSGYSPFLTVDSVLLNGIPLTNEFRYADYYLYPFDSNAFLSPVTWRVSGANGIPSFTHTLNEAFPEVTMLHFSSIGRDTAFRIELPAQVFALADSVWVILDQMIIDGSGGLVSLKHSVPPATRSALFTPAELSLLRGGYPAELKIIAANYDTLKLPDGTFHFGSVRECAESLRIE